MIKAIETQYKGYRFRSRLEARWAVFFDALGLSWEYEPEGFDLGEHGWYLPDFYVRGLDAYVEVKGKCPTHEERQRCYKLSAGTKTPVFLVYGPPSHERCELIGWDHAVGSGIELYAGEGWENWVEARPTYHATVFHFDYYFGDGSTLHEYLREQCPHIEVPDPVDEAARKVIVQIDMDHHLRKHGKPHPWWVYGRHCKQVGLLHHPKGATHVVERCALPYVWSELTASACAKARSARFEHGECPA